MVCHVDGSHTPQKVKVEKETPNTEVKERFMKLLAKARQYADNGNVLRAMQLNEKALALQYSDKLKKRIDKMKVNLLFCTFCEVVASKVITVMYILYIL